MKLLHFKKFNEVGIGLLTKKGILDIKSAGEEFKEEFPDDLDDLIKNVKLLEKIKELEEKVSNYSSLYLREEDLEFLPVILNPEKIICVGANYLKHAIEGDFEIAKHPVLFNKYNNALAAHNQEIEIPKGSKEIDYEGELVIVIGKEGKDIEERDGLDYVFGYSIGNDLTDRELQRRSTQWMLGKSLDKFGPIGPYVVTREEIDPSKLKIETRVNGELRQSSTTEDMIFNCETIVSYISKYITLKPGDLIFTGTPEGVILGYPKEKQIWLKPGDKIEVTIEKIGTLINTLK
ncbi:MAG TPA: fumarylacetoacetate hydrolase family protein [Eubacteriaceae bacterium]|nr:fumarylacetoacetate hydrolase family protein [Eubacteriaceae bacterium]